MIYELTETNSAQNLFKGWAETMIYSCVQRVMGKLYAAEQDNPKSVMAMLGDFIFYAGEPCRELVMNKPKGFMIMVPQNDDWFCLIKDCYADKCRQVTRYATKKNTIFNEEYLTRLIAELPADYQLRFIDEAIYDQCMENQWSKDFVSVFKSKNAYLEKGLGIVAIKHGEVVAGASSYTRYREGIEIEVDTRMDERRKHLATACSAKLILECLKRGLYPSWDAQNLCSLRLAEKLGYEFSHEYFACEVD
ncbi:MAG: GNAT family N-acetyltransferase [Roseburia sp.]|nr:GNAT family N-acetyltransferase [Roseburia sp.]MCM1098891.1 GNAT family N-acetyltransferase [Ruminococcus flavefaciens]